MSVGRQAWVWLDPAVLIAVHEEQLAEHGGTGGTRDLGLFESVLAQPQNVVASCDPDVFELAAAYGCGIARNHPFIDGNKRTAFVAVELFLVLNGLELVAEDASCVLTMLAVASGALEAAGFAQWLREHSAAVKHK